MLITALAAAVPVLVDGRRVGLQHAWAFLLVIPLVSLASALPLFL